MSRLADLLRRIEDAIHRADGRVMDRLLGPNTLTGHPRHQRT